MKKDPPPPYTIAVGGSKIGSKIHILKTFLDVADNILIGGGIAFPFIKYLGGQIGNSIYQEKELEVVKIFLTEAKQSKTKILLPIDCLITENIEKQKNLKFTDIMNIPKDCIGVDIGPKTIQLFSEIISNSKSIMWNGPMGISEIDVFANGTKSLAKMIKKRTNSGGYSLIGGGDTISDLHKFGFKGKFTYVSTGGGAMLEFFRNEDLPGTRNLKSIIK